MWIAKPIQNLTEAEIRAWTERCQEAQGGTRGEGVPLAQTLSWGAATEALGARAYLVFSPEERAGGLAYSADLRQFECTNGPLLDWDNPTLAPRQLATFATAVSRLSAQFESLELRPRWDPMLLESRQAYLPIQPLRVDRAASWVVPIAPTPTLQESRFSPRLKRTLKHSIAATTIRVEVAESETLPGFVQNLRGFGRERGFFVPGLPWFEALAQSSEFSLHLIRAESSDRRTELLLLLHGSRAHYLFGYDQAPRRLKASLSTAAVAHAGVLELLRGAGVSEYDLNGFAEDLKTTDPYYGVCRFKQQLGGAIERYAQPVFRIE